MKHLRITEKDESYVSEFGGFLVHTLGATSLDSHNFEVPDDVNVEGFHGVIVVGSEDDFSTRYPEEIKWLNSYSGDFEFYLSLVEQFKTKGELSPKQIACVTRAVLKDKAVVNMTPQVFTIEAGTVIVVNKSIAQDIASKAGFHKPHFAFLILEVLKETPKAYQLKVRLNASRTVHCCCCGIRLKNPESIRNGIGPICAEKTGISFGVESLEELESALKVTVDVVTWLPKSSIKEKRNVDGTVEIIEREYDYEYDYRRS